MLGHHAEKISLVGMEGIKIFAHTLLGAFIWCSILTWIGYAIGELVNGHR